MHKNTIIYYLYYKLLARHNICHANFYFDGFRFGIFASTNKFKNNMLMWVLQEMCHENKIMKIKSNNLNVLNANIISYFDSFDFGANVT